MAEQLANFGNTTLAAALDDSETSVTVTSGAVFPASGNFRVNCEDEIMLVTSRSTNTLTVTRGAEGTTAAAHGNGVNIRMVLTAAGLANIIDEVATLHTNLSVGTETYDISRAEGGTHDLTLTGNPTFTLSGALTDKATDIRLILRQDGTGSRTVTWPGSVTWANGVAPGLQTAANAVDTVGLVTVDDGTTWIGYYGDDFDNPMTASGDIIYGGASGVVTRLAKSTDGKVLTLASGVPSWATPSGGSAFVGASVYKSADQENLSAGTSTKVTFSTTHYDTDSIFNDANDRMVVPAGKAGKWQFSGQLCMKELTDGSETLCVLKLNNTTDYLVGRYSLSSSTKQIACSFCIILSLAEADYVEMWAQHASANSDVRSGANLTTLQATFLG